MSLIDIPVPHLTTAHTGPLHPVEELILNQATRIERFFQARWLETPPPITSSMDLRHAGFKIAPVDTNLFPAGFNNLNPDFLPMCVQAARAILGEQHKNILILPESHTRNRFYLKSLAVLRDVLSSAGFGVRIGSLDPTVSASVEFELDDGDPIVIEPIIREGQHIGLNDFIPDLLLLNNDLSSGVPEILHGLKQPIQPSIELGWVSRLKSNHFNFYNSVAIEFAQLLGFDPWLINPLFSAVEQVDFMHQTGLEMIALEVDDLLARIAAQYAKYDILEKPFVVVKADNGTYGMSVMMVHSGAQLLQMNRKQRTSMAATKGSRKVSRVIIQEGVYTFESMPSGAVAEPVVYLMGPYVVGGFYRVHQGRGIDENLNAPGMHFEPLAFATACDKPNKHLAIVDTPNRFYVYGVIARLAALAAAREIDAIQKELSQ